MKKIKLIISSAILVVFLCIGLIGYKVYKSFKQSLDGQVTAINNTTQEVNNIKNSINSVAGQISNNYKLTDDSLSTVNLNLVINNYDISLDLREINPTVAAKSLFVGENKISLDVPNETEVLINGTKYHDNFILELDTLSKTNKISIEVQKDNGDYREILIPTLPESFPQLEMGGSGYTHLKGDYYADVHRAGDSFVYKMSLTGEIKYYYRSTNKSGSVNNFKKLILNNKVYYSFFEAVDDFNKIPNVGIEFGEIVLLDSQYNEVNRIRLQETDKVPQGGYVENHDYVFLDIDHYILLSEKFSPIMLSNGNTKEMRSTYIQEYEKGKVVFEWLSSEHEKLNDSYTFLGMERDEDYMHTNSLEIDKSDNNLIISNRHQDSVIKIDRITGEILWTLGGKNDDYGLKENQLMSKQHSAFFNFDNGNDNKLTKIKMFDLDEDTKKVVDYKEYTFGNKFSTACGNVQQISDDLYLIGWGFSSNDVIATVFDFKNNKIISEIVSSVNTVYRVQYYD